MGANCIVIQKELLISNCPLPDGTCFFKHRQTGYCKYKEVDGYSTNELADLVGLPRITDEQYREIHTSIKSKLESIK